MKLPHYIIIVVFLLFTMACNQSSSSNERTWYETIEDAIKFGLQEEAGNLLRVEEVQDEFIVFYEHRGALGVASITENEKGYSWFRSKPYMGFESGSPYSVGGFEFETESGLKVPIIAGKVFDNTIDNMKFIENSVEVKLEIHERSRLFFSTHHMPFSSLEVLPIRN